MSHLAALPIMVPLTTAVLCFVAWKALRAQRSKSADAAIHSSSVMSVGASSVEDRVMVSKSP